MNIQFIEHNGQRQYAIVPAELYEELVEKAEMLDDIKAFDASLTQDEELIPHDVLQRIVAGESKLKVWREYRGFTQIDLSKQASVSQPTIAQLETGQRTGTLAMLKKLAKVLHVDIDDLI
jgi:DNA-binding XRE family transcriptional regulator